MAPIGNDVSVVAPVKNRILCDVKCVKCRKTVRNGILCDNCDLWHHFRCGNLTDENIPSDESEWFCPRCISTSSITPSKQVSLPVASKTIEELETLKEIISILEEDKKSLKLEVENLRSQVPNNGLSRPSCSKPNQSTITNSRRWESVKSRNSSGLASRMFDTSSKPPFQLNMSNKFSILSIEEKNETVPDHQIQPTVSSRPKNKFNLPKPKKKSKSIKIFADSHGRGLSSLFHSTKLKTQFNIEGTVKPGFTFEGVVPSTAECSSLTSEDFVVLIGGSNDVSRNETENATKTLKDTLSSMKHTNVIVVDIPHRHDLADFSCVNKEIQKANSDYSDICKLFTNVSLIKTSNCSRFYHTKHGQHFNVSGKKVLQNCIAKIVAKSTTKVAKN